MPTDSLMTAKQLAEYLSLNERTVLKLVAEGTIPGVKIGNQWRFRKAMIDTWLDDQMLGVTIPSVESPRVDRGPPERLDGKAELAAYFQPAHIILELTASTKLAVVEELSAFAHQLGLVRDKNWFTGALIERENVLPSAVGNGVAFLHTLRRHPEQVTRPFMILGRSTPGIDFDALDGKPTHLFFVFALRTQERHLPWLHKLSQMLLKPGAVEGILNAPDTAALYQVLADAERSLEP